MNALCAAADASRAAGSAVSEMGSNLVFALRLFLLITYLVVDLFKGRPYGLDTRLTSFLVCRWGGNTQPSRVGDLNGSLPFYFILEI